MKKKILIFCCVVLVSLFAGCEHSEAFKNAAYAGRLNADGQPHGRGVCVYNDSDKYDGWWVNGKKNGEGAYTWSGGSKYVGQWINSDMHGEGTFTWADGTKYIGQFADDKVNCIGTMFYTDGLSAHALWKDGEFVEYVEDEKAEKRKKIEKRVEDRKKEDN